MISFLRSRVSRAGILFSSLKPRPLAGDSPIQAISLLFFSYCKKIYTLCFGCNIYVSAKWTILEKRNELLTIPVNQFPVQNMIHKGSIGVVGTKVANNQNPSGVEVFITAGKRVKGDILK